MNQNLQDELARVRAREKRYKDRAEAQIASLQEQLETMTAAKNRAEVARSELENRCRLQDDERAIMHNRIEALQAQVQTSLTTQSHVESQKSKFENRCMHFEEENAQLQKKLLASTSEIEKLKFHFQEIKNENARFYEEKEDLKRNLVLVNILCGKIQTLHDIVSTAKFFQDHESDILKQLQQQGAYSGLDLVTLIRRCTEEEDVVAAVWRAIQTLVSKGDTEPESAKECLQGILSWYNLNTQNQLQAFNISPHNGLLGAIGRALNDNAAVAERVLVPGLANRIGIIIVGPLLHHEDK